MPRNYGQPFWRVTYSGRLYSAEKWSISLSVVGPTGQPTQADADAARTAFWPGMRGSVTSNVVMETAKVARIGADGLYGAMNAVVSTQPAFESSGSGTGTLMPPQCALAVTLLGSQPRAAAGRGRFYLPAPAVTFATDGRISAANAESIANAAAGLVNRLNAALNGDVCIVGPQTEKGRAPAYQRVAGVRVGRVVDTVRSRRSSFPEEPVTATTAISGPFDGSVGAGFGGGGGDF